MQDQLPDTLEEAGAPMAGAEARRERELLEALLAPMLASCREDPPDGLARGERRECSSVRVTRLGDRRAFVNCVVTVETKAGRRRFQNARLFVLDSTRPGGLPGWTDSRPPAPETPTAHPR